MKPQFPLGIILVIAICRVTAYSQHGTSATAGIDSAEAALLKTDSAFNKLSVEKGFVEAFLAYMADSAVLFPNGSNPISGRENIRKHFSEGSAGDVLTWKPLKAEVASSIDLGYTYGTSAYRSTGKDGRLAIHYGKYVTVWRKQADGSWKFILDIGNSSPPAGGK